MTDRSTRLSEEAKQGLDRHKRPDESYEDVIGRLIERDRWTSFGRPSETVPETRSGLDSMRAELQVRMVDRIETY